MEYSLFVNSDFFIYNIKMKSEVISSTSKHGIGAQPSAMREEGEEKEKNT